MPMHKMDPKMMKVHGSLAMKKHDKAMGVKPTKMKTGPANFLQEGTKKPFTGSPTNFLKDKKKGVAK